MRVEIQTKLDSEKTRVNAEKPWIKMLFKNSISVLACLFQISETEPNQIVQTHFSFYLSSHSYSQSTYLFIIPQTYLSSALMTTLEQPSLSSRHQTHKQANFRIRENCRTSVFVLLILWVYGFMLRHYIKWRSSNFVTLRKNEISRPRHWPRPKWPLPMPRPHLYRFQYQKIMGWC